MNNYQYLKTIFILLRIMDQLIHCQECGWIIPKELGEKFSIGESIYCEECGAEIGVEELEPEQLKPVSQANEKLKKAYSTMKSKTFNFKTKVIKAKVNLKKYIEKYKEK